MMPMAQSWMPCWKNTARAMPPITTAASIRTHPPCATANAVIYLVPQVGLISFARDRATARIAAEFYINAINVMRGAAGVSKYKGLPEQEAFNIEYWLLEEAKLARMPKPKEPSRPRGACHRRRIRYRSCHRGESSRQKALVSQSLTSMMRAWPKSWLTSASASARTWCTASTWT